jgi:hypothetical protein
MAAFEPYLPLNALKPFADSVWIVDGPEIPMSYGPFALPFTTRMVVVRLASGALWVHSPIAPDAQLLQALDALGPVRYLVAPNSIHYWYMADWLDRYRDATSYAVPGLARSAKRSFRIDQVLDEGLRTAWNDEIDWAVVPGTAVTEAAFHVRAASTVILADLIENFELPRIRNRLLRLLVRLGGADGGTPHDLRMTFWPKRREVGDSVRRILAWRPDKVIMAHGRPYASDGAAHLERALGWAI